MKDIIRMSHKIRKYYNHLCDDVLEKYNLTKCELDILLFLYNNPELNTAKDIVDKRGIVKSHASLGIDKLINKHYIESIRDENDKRKYHLHLLEDANPIIIDGLKVQKKFNKSLLKGVSKEDKKVMKKIMKQISKNVKEESKC